MEETTVTPQVQTEETPQPYLPSWERIDRSRGKKELVLKPLTDVLNVGDQKEALTRAERMLAGPNEDHVERMRRHRDNPEVIGMFDHMYGKGAAEAVTDPSFMENIAEIPYGLLHGAGAAGDEIGTSVEHGLEWLAEKVGYDVDLDLNPNLNEGIPKPYTGTGKAFSGLFQFGTGYAATFPAKAIKAGKVMKTALPWVRSALSDGFAFDPDDPMFLDLVSGLGMDSGQTSKWLHDPDDSEMEKRIIRMVDGAIPAVALSVLFKALKSAKASIMGNKPPDDIDKQVSELVAEVKELDEAGAVVKVDSEGKKYISVKVKSTVDDEAAPVTPEGAPMAPLADEVQPVSPIVDDVVDVSTTPRIDAEGVDDLITSEVGKVKARPTQHTDPDILVAEIKAKGSEVSMLETRGRNKGHPDERFVSTLKKIWDDTTDEVFFAAKTTREQALPVAKNIADSMVEAIKHGVTPESLTTIIENGLKFGDGPSLMLATKSVIKSLDVERAVRAKAIKILEKEGDTNSLKIANQLYDDNLATYLMISKFDEAIGSTSGATLKARQFVPFVFRKKMKDAIDFTDEVSTPSVTTVNKKGEPTKTKKITRQDKVMTLEKLQELRRDGIRVQDAEDYIDELMKGGEIPVKNIFGKMSDKPTLLNKFFLGVNEYRTSAGLLSGPKTFEINAITGIANTIFSPLVEAVGKGSLGQATTQYVGMAKGYARAGSAIVQAFRTGEIKLTNSGSRLENNTTEMIPGIGGSIIRTPGKILLATDAALKEFNYSGAVYLHATELAKRSGLKGDALKAFVKKELKASYDETTGLGTNSNAREVADIRTFTKDFQTNSKYGGERFLGVLQDGLNRSVLSRLIVTPFFRTPIRLVESGLRYMPGAQLTMKRMRDDLEGNNGLIAQYKARGERMIGMSIVSGAWLLAENGDLTGVLSSDPKERALQKGRGIRPERIRINGTWYNYQQLEPLATPLRIIAEAVEAKNRLLASGHDRYINQEDKIMEMAGGAFVGLLHSLRSSPMMEPVDKWFKLFEDTEKSNTDKLWKALARETLTLVPNILRKATTEQNDFRQESYGPNLGPFEAEFSRGVGPKALNYINEKLGVDHRFAEPDSVRDTFGNKLEITKDTILGVEYTPHSWVIGMDQKVASNKYLSVIDKAQKKSGVSFAFPKGNMFNVDLTRLATSDGKESLYSRWQDNVTKINHSSLGTLEEALESKMQTTVYIEGGWGSDGNPGKRTLILKTVIDAYREIAFAQLLKDEESLRNAKFSSVAAPAFALLSNHELSGKGHLSKYFERD